MGVTPSLFEESDVLVPVMVRERRIEFFFLGHPLSLREGAVGELLLPRSSVLDDHLLSLLEEKREIVLLTKGNFLYAQVSGVAPGAEGILTAADGIESPSGDWFYAALELHETLHLKLDGTKQPSLARTKTRIPLMKVEANSLNHACTLLSERFERSRQSHTANVFKKVFFVVEESQRTLVGERKVKNLRPLDDLRAEQMALFEKRFDVKK